MQSEDINLVLCGEGPITCPEKSHIFLKNTLLGTMKPIFESMIFRRLSRLVGPMFPGFLVTGNFGEIFMVDSFT